MIAVAARDFTDRFVPPDEVLQAQLTAALDALERLVRAFPELVTQYSDPPRQRALKSACAVLAAAGRSSR